MGWHLRLYTCNKSILLASEGPNDQVSVLVNALCQEKEVHLFDTNWCRLGC
jgi:hypothetical protein